MTLAELYHRLRSDIVMLCRQEDRRAFLSVLTAGFDEEGEAIPIELHQEQLLKCLGCEHCNTAECRKCADFPVETGQ
jgi:hypothetical protein